MFSPTGPDPYQPSQDARTAGEESLSFRYWLEDTIKRFEGELQSGDHEVDNDHRQVLELAFSLSDAVAAGHSETLIEDAVTRLRTYVREHFSREEALMLRVGYPGLEPHQREHHRLASACDALTQEYLYGRTHVGYLHRFLRDLVLSHIPRLDQPLVRWMREKGK